MASQGVQWDGIGASTSHRLDAARAITMNGVIEALHIYDDNRYALYNRSSHTVEANST